MKTETNRTTQTPEEVLNELRGLVAEAQRMLRESSRGGCDCDLNLASLRERFESAQERCAELCTDAKQRVIAGAKTTDAAIRENPYASLAIAAGVGLLAGVFLGRRSLPPSP